MTGNDCCFAIAGGPTSWLDFKLFIDFCLRFNGESWLATGFAKDSRAGFMSSKYSSIDR